MKVYFLNCSDNQENYNLCLEEKKAGFKFKAPEKDDLIFLIIKRRNTWYCGAKGILKNQTQIKPWENPEDYHSAFDVDWQLCQEFDLTDGLRKIYSNYGLALQPAKVLFDDSIPNSGFENKGEEFMKFMEENFTKSDSFFTQIQKFLDQAKGVDLKTSSYFKTYNGLSVKVSFGQGNQAKVPWISFLYEGQTTSDGIYPVYLLYKEIKKLVLAHGVSETVEPKLKWNVDAPPLSKYFADNRLGDPSPYPNSFHYKIYDLEKPLNEHEINDDLNNLIDKYKQTMQKKPNSKVKDSFQYKKFIESIQNTNLLLNENLVLRFISSLLTKPFVILTGLSGAGKTKLALTFAKWICESEDQICVVPVGADWTNRDPLLGYSNALEREQYILPENGALSLILRASKVENLQKPFFLILDEMNLSHVERYFADFLSAMESKSSITLHTNKSQDPVPSRFVLPSNLFIIGTVNIDETTYMFSPKVLDRASVLEFRVDSIEMNSFLENKISHKAQNIDNAGSSMGGNFVELANSETKNALNVAELTAILVGFFDELKKVGAEFGYRTATEIVRFVSVAQQIESNWSLLEIVDAAIMQKLLPKVHGSRRRLEPVIEKLASLCLVEKTEFKQALAENGISKDRVRFPLSLEKTRRIYKCLHDNGFASYAEA